MIKLKPLYNEIKIVSKITPEIVLNFCKEIENKVESLNSNESKIFF